MPFYLKQNDTVPSIQTTLLDGDGLPQAITGFSSLKFFMRNAGGTVIVNADATAVDAAVGLVQYDWDAADTGTAGSFQAEFQVTYADGGVETFPNKGYIEVVITDDIA